MKRALALSVLVCALASCQPSTDSLTQPQDHCGSEQAGLGDLDQDGDGLLRSTDLEPGEAAMVALWTDSDGAERTGRYRNMDTTLGQGNGLGEVDKFGFWFRVDCEPQQASFVWFKDDEQAPFTLGERPLWALTWDIPDVEQGGSILDGPNGHVELVESDAESTWVSGHLVGVDQSFELISYLTQEGVGDRVEIQAMAFREVPVEWH